MIYKCTGMTYLDNRPVQHRDRLCIAAWAKVSHSHDMTSNSCSMIIINMATTPSKVE